MMFLVKADGTRESLSKQHWVPIHVNGTAKMYTTQMVISEGMVKIIHTMRMALMTAIVYGFAVDKGYGHTHWNQKFLQVNYNYLIFDIIHLLSGLFPHITKFSSEDSEINLKTNNHNISLYCETDRRLIISWEKENGTVRHTASGAGTNLTLTNLRPEDAGNYRCVVRGLFHGNCYSNYAAITINGND